MLEADEINLLMKGKVLIINEQIGVQFDRKGEMAASADLRCDICGTTTTKAGKPFVSTASVVRHKLMDHKGMAAKVKATKQGRKNGHRS